MNDPARTRAPETPSQPRPAAPAPTGHAHPGALTDRKHPAYRLCPLHGNPMRYQGAGLTWNHLWQCQGQGTACMWGATSLRVPMVAGWYGCLPGGGYLTWEQWLAATESQAS